MNRLYALPEVLVNYIFEYYNPYVPARDLVLYELSWYRYWYDNISYMFYIQRDPFYRYMLYDLHLHTGDLVEE